MQAALTNYTNLCNELDECVQILICYPREVGDYSLSVIRYNTEEISGNDAKRNPFLINVENIEKMVRVYQDQNHCEKILRLLIPMTTILATMYCMSEELVEKQYFSTFLSENTLTQTDTHKYVPTSPVQIVVTHIHLFFTAYPELRFGHHAMFARLCRHVYPQYYPWVLPDSQPDNFCHLNESVFNAMLIESKLNKANEISISQNGPRIATIDDFITHIKSPVFPDEFNCEHNWDVLQLNTSLSPPLPSQIHPTPSKSLIVTSKIFPANESRGVGIYTNPPSFPIPQLFKLVPISLKRQVMICFEGILDNVMYFSERFVEAFPINSAKHVWTQFIGMASLLLKIPYLSIQGCEIVFGMVHGLYKRHHDAIVANSPAAQVTFLKKRVEEFSKSMPGSGSVLFNRLLQHLNFPFSTSIHTSLVSIAQLEGHGNLLTRFNDIISLSYSPDHVIFAFFTLLLQQYSRWCLFKLRDSRFVDAKNDDSKAAVALSNTLFEFDSKCFDLSTATDNNAFGIPNLHIEATKRYTELFLPPNVNESNNGYDPASEKHNPNLIKYLNPKLPTFFNELLDMPLQADNMHYLEFFSHAINTLDSPDDSPLAATFSYSRALFQTDGEVVPNHPPNLIQLARLLISGLECDIPDSDEPNTEFADCVAEYMSLFRQLSNAPKVNLFNELNLLFEYALGTRNNVNIVAALSLDIDVTPPSHQNVPDPLKHRSNTFTIQSVVSYLDTVACFCKRPAYRIIANDDFLESSSRSSFPRLEAPYLSNTLSIVSYLAKSQYATRRLTYRGIYKNHCRPSSLQFSNVTHYDLYTHPEVNTLYKNTPMNMMTIDDEYQRARHDGGIKHINNPRVSPSMDDVILSLGALLSIFVKAPYATSVFPLLINYNDDVNMNDDDQMAKFYSHFSKYKKQYGLDKLFDNTDYHPSESNLLLLNSEILFTLHSFAFQNMSETLFNLASCLNLGQEISNKWDPASFISPLLFVNYLDRLHRFIFQPNILISPSLPCLAKVDNLDYCQSCPVSPNFFLNDDTAELLNAHTPSLTAPTKLSKFRINPKPLSTIPVVEEGLWYKKQHPRLLTRPLIALYVEAVVYIMMGFSHCGFETSRKNSTNPKLYNSNSPKVSGQSDCFYGLPSSSLAKAFASQEQQKTSASDTAAPKVVKKTAPQKTIKKAFAKQTAAKSTKSLSKIANLYDYNNARVVCDENVLKAVSNDGDDGEGDNDEPIPYSTEVTSAMVQFCIESFMDLLLVPDVWDVIKTFEFSTETNPIAYIPLCSDPNKIMPSIGNITEPGNDPHGLAMFQPRDVKSFSGRDPLESQILVPTKPRHLGFFNSLPQCELDAIYHALSLETLVCDPSLESDLSKTALTLQEEIKRDNNEDDRITFPVFGPQRIHSIYLPRVRNSVSRPNQRFENIRNQSTSMITPAPTTQSNNPLAVPTSAFAIAPDPTVSILNHIVGKILSFDSPYRPDSFPSTGNERMKPTSITYLDSGETVHLAQLQDDRPFAVHATTDIWTTKTLCEALTAHLGEKE